MTIRLSLSDSHTIYEFTYTNWKGVTRTRRAQFWFLWWGSTEHHSEPQWLIDAWDVEKDDDRTFALADISDLKVTK